MKKQMLKITAKTRNDKTLNLEFVSIKQAKFFNKDLTDFEVIGLIKDKNQK